MQQLWNLVLGLLCLWGAGTLTAAPGELRWEFPVGATVQSSPAIGPDGTIYFGADNGLVYALDPQGKKKWELATGGAVVASVAVGADGTVYIASTDRIIYALNPDGSEKWRLMPGSGMLSSPALGPDGVLYVGSVFNRFFALDTRGLTRWEFPTQGNLVSSAAVGADGTLYIGCWDTNFYAITPEGARKWVYKAEDRISSSPAINSDGTLYFGAFDKYLYAISPEGERLWDYATGEAVRGSPVITPDGLVLVGSDDGLLHAVSARGTRRWVFATEGFVRSTPAIAADGTIYFGSYDGKLYALGADGAKRWEFATAGYVSGSPAIGADGTVCFGSWDKKFYALAGTAPLASSPWPTFRQNARRTGSLAPEKRAGHPPPSAPVSPPVVTAPATNTLTLPPVRPVVEARVSAITRSNSLPIKSAWDDRVRPTVTIQTPAANARLEKGLVSVAGTARDNEGLARVEYRVNGGPVDIAEGKGNWEARVRLVPGNNVVEARSVDLAGNESDWANRSFQRVVTSPLFVRVNGQGSINPNLAGESLEVGRSYTLTAAPAKGFVFGGWTGAVSSASARLSFVMQTNLVLTANFVPRQPEKPPVATPPAVVPPVVKPEPPPKTARVTVQVDVRVTGEGRVTPDLAGRALTPGKTVTLTAKPAPGFSFRGWSGGVEARSTELVLTVASNLVVQANFAPNPFQPHQGEYSGLLQDTNQPSHATSGAILLTVNAEGGWKGSIEWAGETELLGGRFDADGWCQLAVKNYRRSPGVLTLQLDLAGQTGQIAGKYVEGAQSVALLADRCVFDARKHPAPWAGRYTLILAAPKEETNAGGDGFATVTVSPSGAVTLAGQLGGGSTFSVESSLSREGVAAIYTPLEGGQGSLGGWLTFTNGHSDIVGTLLWHPAAGGTRRLRVAGSTYVAPPAGGAVLAGHRFVLALSQGGLPDLAANLLRLDPGNKVLIEFSEVKLALSFNRETGQFSGSFIHPDTQRLTSFQGVVLQKQNWGSGYFLSKERSGLVFLGPDKGETPAN
jgi:outer membrane protein assembly factor BamB